MATRIDAQVERGAEPGGFEAYIAVDRRGALLRGERMPDRTSGAVLFADLSGFSALAEALTERLGAQAGAEELARRVNAALSEVILQVHRFGGSVVGFPGDAVTCWFDGDDGRQATAAALAARAAIPSEGDEELGVKLVVAAGLARRFSVGHPRIQRIDVLAGGILDRVAVAEELARRGEVLIGSEVVGWARDRIRISGWRQDTSQLTDRRTPEGEWFAVVEGRPEDVGTAVGEPSLDPLDPEVARDWLLPPLFERLRAGQAGIGSEMRSVATLFLQFGGIQYDMDNAAEDKLDRFVRWVQTVLARYQAFLLQLVVGDKGSYLYAAFGAPLAHEDDSVRAVAAAAELSRPPEELAFAGPLRIGVAEGKMLAGSLGSPEHKTYAVLGPAANRAARLMQAARPGQVLVHRGVAETVAARFRLDDPGDGGEVLALVGERPVPVELTPIDRPPVEMVGRAREREVLASRLARLLDGDGGAVVVEGAPGIGKSRLLAELESLARDLGVTVLVGAGSDIHRNTPFHAWGSVFTRLFGLGEDARPREVENAVRAHLADRPELAELIPLLDPVLPVDLPETPLTERMPAAARSDNALTVLLACLERPRTPLGLAVVILDDAQWLDSASWALVHAASHLPHLLIATGSRPAEAVDPAAPGPSEVARLAAGSEADHVVLDPLTDREILELVVRRLGVDTLPGRLAEAVVERSEGNPLFAEELIGGLVDRGLVEVVDGKVVRMASDAELREEFPRGLERLLTSRLDRLPPHVQRVLVTASVLGRSFARDLLEAAVPDEWGPLDAVLDSLLGQGILDEADGALRFRHVMLREAAYELLPPSRRAEVHARAAAWIEREAADNLPAVAAVAAHHWDRAGDAGKALEHLDVAAAAAFRSSAYEEAVRLYQRAVELSQGEGRAGLGRRHLRLGEVLVHIQQEDVTAGRRHLERGLGVIGEDVPGGPVAASFGLVWQLVVHLANRLRRRGRSPEDRATLLEASRAFERLVEVYYVSGETVLALYASLRALNLAEAAGPSPELARGLATVGALFGFVPLRGTAERYLDRALDTVRPEADPEAAAWVSLAAAFYHAGAGHWGGDDPRHDADHLARAVVGLSREIGDRRREEDGISNLMIQAALRGDPVRGLELAEQLTEMAESREALPPLAYGLQGKAYSLLELGRLDEAAEAAAALVEVVDESEVGDRSLEDDSRGLLALVEAAQGRLRRAEETVEVLLARLAWERPTNFSAFAAYSAPYEVALTRWERTGTAPNPRTLRLARRLLRRYARVFPVGRPRLLLCEARRARLRGREAAALRLLEEAVDLAAELGVRGEEARIRSHLDRPAA